jgi:hypothetical protein
LHVQGGECTEEVTCQQGDEQEITVFCGHSKLFC